MLSIIEANLNNPEHANAVLYLLNHYALDEMGGGEPLSDFVQNNLISELCKRSTAHVVLAFDEQDNQARQAVGMIISFEGFSTFACKPLLNLHDVVVHQNFRGQRIFKQMLDCLENIAQRLGCCKLTMEVLEGNKAAKSTYQACGFSGYALGSTTGYAVFWQKKLPQN